MIYILFNGPFVREAPYLSYVDFSKTRATILQFVSSYLYQEKKFQ